MTPLEALERLYNYPSLRYKSEILYLLEQENLPIYYEIVEKALKKIPELEEEISNLRMRIRAKTVANKK